MMHVGLRQLGNVARERPRGVKVGREGFERHSRMCRSVAPDALLSEAGTEVHWSQYSTTSVLVLLPDTYGTSLHAVCKP